MTIETANRLYELRKKHNLSQEELAEKLGVSRQAVSKWERSEASPDTDNLIALAKLYDLSLDELIYGENDGAKQEDSTEASEKISGDDTVYIDVEKENKKVKIGPMGIVVEDGKGETVKIGFNGIHINASDDDDEDDDDFDNDDDEDVVVHDGHIHVEVSKPKNKVKFWLEIPYPIICTVAYLIFGFLDIWGGWGHSWIIFITVPLYYSLVEAIYKRSFDEFAYPVFTVFVFLYLGLYHGIWHPTWIVFLTIPIYSPIAEAIDRKIRARRQEKEENQ